jgi:hypothetical protein
MIIQCSCFGLVYMGNRTRYDPSKCGLMMGTYDAIPTTGAPLPHAVAEVIVKVHTASPLFGHVGADVLSGIVENGQIRLELKLWGGKTMSKNVCFFFRVGEFESSILAWKIASELNHWPGNPDAPRAASVFESWLPLVGLK